MSAGYAKRCGFAMWFAIAVAAFNTLIAVLQASAVCALLALINCAVAFWMRGERRKARASAKGAA